MDRFDEKKHDRRDDVPVDRRDERDEPIREGDVLGLGGSAVPKSPGDPSAGSDPDSVARQRARMRDGEAEEQAAREGDSEDTFGATAVDLGVGKGNTITRK